MSTSSTTRLARIVAVVAAATASAVAVPHAAGAAGSKADATSFAIKPIGGVAPCMSLLLGTLAGVLATRQRSPGPDRPVALAQPAGTSGSPATGTGTALLPRQRDGVGVRLRLTGLGPNDDGSHYECWWVGAKGRVAAGSFQVGADGTADVRLTVAGNLDGSFRPNVNRVGNGTETNVLTATATVA